MTMEDGMSPGRRHSAVADVGSLLLSFTSTCILRRRHCWRIIFQHSINSRKDFSLIKQAKSFQMALG